MQAEMQMFQEVRAPESVSSDLMRLCKSKLDAIRLCVQMSRLPHAAIQDRLGIDKGHWTRMMQGRAHFPTNKEGDLMRLCGNLAPLQWAVSDMGMSLGSQVDEAAIIRAVTEQLNARRTA
jgi:hypothetical protein